MEDQTQLLQALYQEYLTKTIQLTEENLSLKLKLQELESAGEEASGDSEATS